MHQIDLRICVADFHLDSVSRVQDGCDWLMQKSRQEMCRWLRLLNLPARQIFTGIQTTVSFPQQTFGLYKEMIFPHKIQPQENVPLGVEFVGEFYQKDFGISLMGTLWNSCFWMEFTQMPLTTEVWPGLKVCSRDSLLMFWVVNVPDVSSKSSFAEWESWTSDTSAFFHGSRCKDKSPTSLWEKVPQTCHCQESSLSQCWANLRRSRDRGRRVPYSSGTSTRQQQGQQQEVPLLCGVMEIAPSLPGVMQTMVVTMVVTSAVRDQLKGVLQIQATGRAFAAILARCCRINWSSGPPIGHPRTNWRSRRSIAHAASGKYCSKGPTCGSL